MKKRTIGIISGIVTGIAGLVGLVTPVIISRAEKANVEALGIYIENPELPEAVKKVGEAVARHFSDTDYFKGFTHPQSGRVQYNFPWDPQERVTSYVDSDKFRIKNGRTPYAIITAKEKRVGPNLWQFQELECKGYDLTPEMVAEARTAVPWIFGAQERNETYMLQTFPDEYGKVRKVVYTLANGETITLEDTNGNCIADIVREN